jgi:hypothetical protein
MSEDPITRYLNLMTTQRMAVIPEGAKVAYTDASVRHETPGTGRCAVVLDFPDDYREIVFDPGEHDINVLEKAAIERAVKEGAEYVVTDSRAAIDMLGGKNYRKATLVLAHGDATCVPLHDRADELAREARQKAEAGG